MANGGSSEGQVVLQTLGSWFHNLGQWLASAGQWFEELILGTIPEDDYEKVYAFAEEWGRLAQALGDYLGEAQPHGVVISGNWSGDATAPEFTRYWRELSEATVGLQQEASLMEMDVRRYGLELEMGFYMYILNLILLAVLLIVDIIMSIFFGVGLGQAVGHFISTRLGMQGVKQSMLAAIKRLALAAARPALTRLALGAGRTAGLRAGVRAITRPVIVGVGRGLAAPFRRGVPPVLGRIGVGLATPLRYPLRGSLRLLGRVAAPRIVPGVSRSILGRVVAGTAGRILGRDIVRVSENALQRQLQRVVAERVAQNIAGRVLGERGAAWLFREGAAQVAERAAVAGVRDVTGRLLSDTATRAVADATFKQVVGRLIADKAGEWAAGIGTRAVLGYGLGAGSNLGAQAITVMHGHRADIDWGAVQSHGLHGGAMLAAMGGRGIVMHTFTGAAGGAAIAGWDGAMQALDAARLSGKHLDIFDGEFWEIAWDGAQSQLGTGALHGAALGAAFGTFGRLHEGVLTRALGGEVRLFEITGGPRDGALGVRFEGRPGVGEFTERGGVWTRGDRTAFFDGSGRSVEVSVRGDRHTFNIGKDVGSALIREAGMALRAPAEVGPAGPRVPESFRPPDAAPATVERSASRPDVEARTPGTDRPVADRPVVDRPAVDRPTERPGGPDRPGSPDRPGDPPADRPPPGEPRAERPDEPMMQSAGAETGEPPTPRSIEQGTVRMEDHPDFPRIVQELNDLGIRLVPTTDPPKVAVINVYDASREFVGQRIELRAQPGMRFLDLEHELDHVRQVTDSRRFPDGALPDEFEGKPKIKPPELKWFQNVVLEYHVRLTEFNRLAERGVDRGILVDHARGVDAWDKTYRYFTKQSYIGRPSKEGLWARERFPEISELRTRSDELRSQLGLEKNQLPPDERPGHGLGEGRFMGKDAGGGSEPVDDARALDALRDGYGRPWPGRTTSPGWDVEVPRTVGRGADGFGVDRSAPAVAADAADALAFEHRIRYATGDSLGWPVERVVRTPDGGALVHFGPDSPVRAVEVRFDVERLGGQAELRVRVPEVWYDADGRAHPSGPIRIGYNGDLNTVAHRVGDVAAEISRFGRGTPFDEATAFDYPPGGRGAAADLAGLSGPEAARIVDAVRSVLRGDRPLTDLDATTVNRILNRPDAYPPEVGAVVREYFSERGGLDGVHRPMTGLEIRARIATIEEVAARQVDAPPPVGTDPAPPVGTDPALRAVRDGYGPAGDGRPTSPGGDVPLRRPPGYAPEGGGADRSAAAVARGAAEALAFEHRFQHAVNELRTWPLEDVVPTGDGGALVRLRPDSPVRAVEVRFDTAELARDVEARVRFPEVWYDAEGRAHPSGPVRVTFNSELRAIGEHVDNLAYEIGRFWREPPPGDGGGPGRGPDGGSGPAGGGPQPDGGTGPGPVVKAAYVTEGGRTVEGGRVAVLDRPRLHHPDNDLVLRRLDAETRTWGGTTPDALAAEAGRVALEQLRALPVEFRTPVGGPEPGGWRPVDPGVVTGLAETAALRPSARPPTVLDVSNVDGAFVARFANDQAIRFVLRSDGSVTAPGETVVRVGERDAAAAFTGQTTGRAAAPVEVFVDNRFVGADPAGVASEVDRRMARAFESMFAGLTPSRPPDAAPAPAPAQGTAGIAPAAVGSAVDDFLGTVPERMPSEVRQFRPDGPRAGVVTFAGGASVPVAVRVGELPPTLPVTARMDLVPVPDTDRSRWLVDITVDGSVAPERVPGLLADQIRALDGWLDRVRDSLVAPGPAAGAVGAALDGLLRSAGGVVDAAGAVPTPLGSGTWAARLDIPADGPVLVRYLDGSAAPVLFEPADLPGDAEAQLVFPPLVFGSAPYGRPAAPVRIRLGAALGAGPAAGVPDAVRRSVLVQLNEVHAWLTTRPDGPDAGQPGRRIVPIPGVVPDRAVPDRSDPVARAVGRYLDEARGGGGYTPVADALRDAGLADGLRLPRSVSWAVGGSTLTLAWADGFTVTAQVSVESALPAAQAILALPPLSRAGDRDGPAVVAVSGYAPADDNALTAQVVGSLWRAFDRLHRELAPPVADAAAPDWAIGRPLPAAVRDVPLPDWVAPDWVAPAAGSPVFLPYGRPPAPVAAFLPDDFRNHPAVPPNVTREWIERTLADPDADPLLRYLLRMFFTRPGPAGSWQVVGDAEVSFLLDGWLVLGWDGVVRRRTPPPGDPRDGAAPAVMRRSVAADPAGDVRVLVQRLPAAEGGEGGSVAAALPDAVARLGASRQNAGIGAARMVPGPGPGQQVVSVTPVGGGPDADFLVEQRTDPLVGADGVVTTIPEHAVGGYAGVVWLPERSALVGDELAEALARALTAAVAVTLVHQRGAGLPGAADAWQLAADLLRAQVHRAAGPTPWFPARSVRYTDGGLLVEPHSGDARRIDAHDAVTHLARLAASGLPAADLRAAAAAEVGALVAASAGDRGRPRSPREPLDRAERARRGALVALAELHADPATPDGDRPFVRVRFDALAGTRAGPGDRTGPALTPNARALYEAPATTPVPAAGPAGDHDRMAAARWMQAYRLPPDAPPAAFDRILDDAIRHAREAATARFRPPPPPEPAAEPAAEPASGQPAVVDPAELAARFTALDERLATDAAKLGLRWDAAADRLDVAGSPAQPATDLLIAAVTAAVMKRRDARAVLAERFGGGEFVPLADDPAGLAPEAVRELLAGVADRLREGPAGGVAYVAVVLAGKADPVLVALVDEPATTPPGRTLLARDPRGAQAAGPAPVADLLRRGYPGTPVRLEVLPDTALRDGLERLRRERRDLAGHGAAGAVGDFHGEARDPALPDLTRAELLAAITADLALVTPDGVRWVDEHLVPPDGYFVLPDGAGDVRVHVGPPAREAATFAGRPDRTGYDITVSRRTRPADLARAVAHELTEIRLRLDPTVADDPVTDDPTTMTAHWGGRLAELRVVLAHLEAARHDPARTTDLPRLYRDLTDLLARIGLADGAGAAGPADTAGAAGDPDAPLRRQVLIGHDPALARRLASATGERPGPVVGYEPGDPTAPNQVSGRAILQAVRAAYRDYVPAITAAGRRVAVVRFEAAGPGPASPGPAGQRSAAAAAAVAADHKIRNLRHLGFEVDEIVLSGDIPGTGFADLVDRLNADPATTAVVVQRPVPERLDATARRIAPDKDLDGARGTEAPALAEAIWRVVEPFAADVPTAAVVGSDGPVGAAVVRLLEASGLAVLKLDAGADPGPVRDVDIVVSVAGTPGLLGAGHLHGRHRLVVDAGLRLAPDGSVAGDVRRDALARPRYVLSYPDGALPVETAILLERLVRKEIAAAPDRWPGAAAPGPWRYAGPPDGGRDATAAAPAGPHAPPERVAEWDTLAAGLDARIAELKRRTDLTAAEKLRYLRDEIAAPVGFAPAPVAGMGHKELRLYTWMTGELYIHAAALMADPATTITLAYEDVGRVSGVWLREARDTNVRYTGPLPPGISADQADVALLWRHLRGHPIVDVDEAALVDALVDLHALPVRQALVMRRNFVDLYGVDPGRIRLVYDQRPVALQRHESRQLPRSHLFALDQIRMAPAEARDAMVEAMLGPPATAADRDAVARAVAATLYATHEPGTGPARYALVWGRDTRTQPDGLHAYDTRPEFVRQAIGVLRELDPDRRVILVGDDLFARRPELRAAWEREGVLDGVDTTSLIRFWEAGRNGVRDLTFGEQALFLHVLNSERDVVQIGMESGAIEIPALLGMPSIYFEALEHDGNKGARWEYYWGEWQLGRSLQDRDITVEPVFDRRGRPVKEFRLAGENRPAPLPTFRRVQFGPRLPDPAAMAVAVHQFATVSFTVDRIGRLLGGGPEVLSRWVGGTRSADGGVRPWDDAQWQRSLGHARHLAAWLQVSPATADEAAAKWEGIRRALAGVLDPVHEPGGAAPGGGAALERAYAARRPEAVVAALRDLLGGDTFRARALADARLFRLDPAEVAALREEIRRALAWRDAARRALRGDVPAVPDDDVRRP